MSGSRAKRERQSKRPQSLRVLNAEAVDRSADAVLRVEVNDYRFRNRVAQVAVGLCRAAFAQSKVIANLARADLLSAAAPNRRLVLEIALRLNWLGGLSSPERRKAVDTMLAKDRDDTNRLVKRLRADGHDVGLDVDEMNAFELDAATSGQLHQQATRLHPAVEASEVNPGIIYSMWLEETESTHASGALAGQYAPTHDDLHMASGSPSPMDPDLEAHRIVQSLIVMTTCRILVDEGFPEEVANRMALAYFG